MQKKKYEVTAYENGVKKTRVVVARDKKEAESIGFEIFYADSIYVEEIE